MKLDTMIATIADRTGFLDAYAFSRRKLTKSQVAILMYHRVGPKTDDWSFEPLSLQSFEKQIVYFCRNYEVISVDQLVNYIQLRKSLPEKAVAITFDDGYKDNYLYAYPMIKKYHVPATIFITTGHIGTGKLFWWDLVNYVIQHSNVNPLNLGKEGCYLIQSETEKIHSNFIICEKMKKMPENEKNFLIKRLIGISNIKNIPSEVGNQLILSWDEIKEMSSEGINFGAHSISHPVLTNMPLEQAKFEIIQSKKDIEKQLGRETIGFSYPDGNFNSTISKYIQESGFSWAVSTFPNKLLSSTDIPYELSRLSVPRDSSKFKVEFCGLWGDLRFLPGRKR